MKHRKTVEQEVINYIKKNDLLSDAKKIIIGLSGGADSVFILHFFSKYLRKFKVELSAIHVNHNLRGEESKRDEKFCKSLCEKLKVEFYSVSVNVKAFAKTNKMSIEEAARVLRYKEFNNAAKISQSDLIITAHNSDDNSETVLLNIVNGTGISGLAGIPVKRENIIRPILCLSKAEIVHYLKENKIKFVRDSSNDSLEFRRNFLRKKIIPSLKKNINPSLDKVLLQSSEVFRSQIGIIDYLIRSIVENEIKINKYSISVPILLTKKYPNDVLGEVFKKIINDNFNFDFSFNQFEKLRNLFNSQIGTQSLLGENIVAIRERSKILIQKAESRKKIDLKIKIGEKVNLENYSLLIEVVKELPEKFNSNSKIEYLAGDNLDSELTLREWKLGDRITSLGMKGTKKISDVLTDLKIPTSKRKNKLVLVNNDEIIWLVGLKISEKYKITNQTKKIVKLCLD